ncbi:hypothetical protein TcCL_ESM08823 [Trypanosoma cruzi]|nr:hypothetical protein TcCL_ESM08823 [Trypanosoma cruzi]
MHAEFHHSATPFKVLPKQSASDTVISHTLPVHRCGKDVDTNGIMCANVGGVNSKHSHTTLAPSVHPTPRLKTTATSTNQQNNEAVETTSLQALQGSTATPPTGACSPLLAAVQASLLLVSRGVEHLPDHLALTKQASRRRHSLFPRMVLPRSIMCKLSTSHHPKFLSIVTNKKDNFFLKST